MPFSIAKRVAIWIALSVPTAALLYCIFAAHLFEQQIWYPRGLQRFEVYTAAFSICSVVILAVLPARYIQIAAASLLIVTAGTVGFGPLIATALFLASSYALGRLVHREPGFVALATGTALYIFVWELIVQIPVNYPLVYIVLFAIPLVINRAAVAETARAVVQFLRLVHFESRVHMVSVAVLTFVISIQWLVTLKPEVSGDGLAMHLAIPAVVANQHLWPFDAKHLTYAVMPMGGDWCYTAVYLIGGEFAARLLNLSFLLIIAALLYRVARRWLSPAGALLIASLWIANPIAQLVTGSLFVENAWALMTTAAFVSIFGPSAYATPILLGTSMSMKFGSLAFVVPAAIAAALIDHGPKRRIATSVLLFLVFAAPAYVTAFARTGNPVFPFANDKFKSPYFESNTPFRDPRFHEPLSWDTLYAVTIHTSRYFEAQNGAFGFEFLALIPAAVVALLLIRLEGRRIAATALTVAAVFWVLTFPAQANARYLYPAMSLMLIGIAWLCSFSRMAVALAGAALALNIWFLPSSGWYHKDFLLLTRSEREEYLKEGAPVRRLVEYMNLTRPGEPVMFLESDQFAGLAAPLWSDTWRHQTLQRKWNGNNDARGELELARSMGVQYFIAPSPPTARSVGWIGTRLFLAICTEPEYQFGDHYIARLKKDFLTGDPRKVFEDYGRRFGAVPPGVYDDTHPAVRLTGSWLTDQQFPQAMNQTITYSDKPGDSFTLNFEGTAISWVFTKAANRGVASVLIDGEEKTVVDLYSPKTEWQSRIVFDKLQPGKHEITVAVQEQKNAASKGRYVDLDALEVSSTQVR